MDMQVSSKSYQEKLMDDREVLPLTLVILRYLKIEFFFFFFFYFYKTEN
jgi:hypothetical protein